MTRYFTSCYFCIVAEQREVNACERDTRSVFGSDETHILLEFLSYIYYYL